MGDKDAYTTYFRDPYCVWNCIYGNGGYLLALYRVMEGCFYWGYGSSTFDHPPCDIPSKKGKIRVYLH